MKNNTQVTLVVFMVLIAFADCAYNREESIANNYYAAITHCPQKEVEAWSCKICPNITAL